MEQEIKKFIGNVDEVVALFKQKVKRIEDERDALQSKCDRYEKALKEIKSGSFIPDDDQLRESKEILRLVIKVAKEALNGEEEKAVVSPEHNVSIGGWITYCHDCGFPIAPINECNCEK